MKIIFVVNPKAGKGRGIDKLKENISVVSEKSGIPAGFYLTKSIGDGEIFARVAAKEAQDKGEELRLISCGGDGTANEVLNGIMGFDNASMGIIPIGTGNDFVRNFAEAGNFLDIEAQLRGEQQKVDVIRYEGMMNGRYQTRYCLNMFNIGFDCNVVDLTAKLKQYPLLKGSLAYLSAVAGILIKKKGANLSIKIDDEMVHEGPLLLTAIANGSYCGGGVKSSPKASLYDGYMDANIIYDVSRREFLQKFPAYSKGTHMELKDIDRIFYFRKCKKVVITPLDEKMRLCTDGEIVDAEEIKMEIIPSAVNFVLPKIL